MKNLIKLMLAFLVITSFSCTKDLGVVTISTTLNDVIHMDVDQTPTEDPIVFEAIEMEIDIENTDTQSYMGNIEEITFENLTFTFENFEGDVNGLISLKFKDAYGTEFFSADNININDAVSNQTQFEVTNLSMLDAMVAELLAESTATIAYSGSYVCSDDNMSFDLKYNADVRVKTNVAVED